MTRFSQLLLIASAAAGLAMAESAPKGPSNVPEIDSSSISTMVVLAGGAMFILRNSDRKNKK